MRAPRKTEPYADITTAEGWFVHLRGDDPGAQARLAFDRWLNASAENRAAWQDLVAIWGDLDALRGNEELLDIRRQALERHASASSGWLSRPRLAAASVAALLLAGAGMLWAVLHRPDASAPPQMADAASTLRFANPVGKRTRILLADGSIVQLDADSALSVSYSEHRRAILLQRGRALFHVAKNRERPFVVTAAGRGITALGTLFSVDIQQRAVRVVLDEGRVRVDDRRADSAAKPGHRVDLSAGHVLLADDRPEWRPEAASTTQWLAWTNGQLLFDDQRLADVVAEVNRYSRVQIVIIDPSLDDRRLSAVLKAGDVDTLLDGIARLDLAQIARVDAGRVELRAKARRIVRMTEDRSRA